MNAPIILADPQERDDERRATSYVDFQLTEVERDDPGRVVITVSDHPVDNQKGLGGWTTSVPWPDTIDPPKVGELVRCYGQAGLGGRLSGLDVLRGDDWIHVFFVTKREMEVEAAAWIADNQREQRKRFETEQARLDADYETLPGPLKRRIDRFRAADPNFRWREESYEMAACAEGGRLYRAAMDPATGETLKAAGIKLPKDLTIPSYQQPKGEGVTDWEDTPDNRLLAIDAINGAPNNYDFPLMERLFPWIDRGHSGNTWGHAVMFARVLIENGEEAKL